MRYFKYYLFKAQWKILEFVLGPKVNSNPPKIGKVIKNIPYNTLHRKQKMDLYIPEGEGPFPILIYAHGGGWTAVDKSTYSRVCKEFASKKCLVCSINFRLGPKYGYPYILKDVADAIYFVYQQANKYNGDPQRIMLAGDSGGAHMVSWYAAALDKRKLFQDPGISKVIPRKALKGLLLFYGAYDLSRENLEQTTFCQAKLVAESFLGENPQEYQRRAAIVSTINHLTSNYPPVFISSGEKDSLHQESVKFAQKLKEHNIPHQALFFPQDKYADAGHAFLNFYTRECAQEAMKKAKAFMNQCLNKKQV